MPLFTLTESANVSPRVMLFCVSPGLRNAPVAAPGASMLPAAKVLHIRAQARDLVRVEASGSDEEDAEVGDYHLKRDYRLEGGHWVDDLFPDGSIETWTLVAKELLTVCATFICLSCVSTDRCSINVLLS